MKSNLMIKNYLKIAFRNILKEKRNSFIAVSGIAISIACSLLILMWVFDELDYDRFSKNADNVYRVVCDEANAVVTAPLVGPTVVNEFPEVIDYCRMFRSGDSLIKIGDKFFNEKNFYFADASIFKMFGFELTEGNPKNALNNPNSVILTEEMAKKYFSNKNPMGKTISVRGKEFKITGIVKETGKNSHLNFNIIVPFQILKQFDMAIDNWSNRSFYTYLLFRDGVDGTLFSDKLSQLVKKNDVGIDTSFNLQPLKRIHLYSSYKWDIPGHGSIASVWIFGIIALLIILVASVNFVSLTIAGSFKRTEEIAMRKVLGANQKKLFKQFFTESVLLLLSTLIFVFVLMEIIMPGFNSITGKNLHFGLSSGNLFFFGISAVLISVLILSVLYPLIILSSFKATQAMKRSSKTGKIGSGFRKALVMFQFAITICLIIASIVVFKQIDHLKNRDLGYSNTNLLCLSMNNNTRQQVETFKNEFKKCTGVESVSFIDTLLTSSGSGTSDASWTGKAPDKKVQMQYRLVDYEFLETMGMKMVMGRFFSKEHITDDRNSVVLNETAVKEMGIESPIGKTFEVLGGERKILGVVKDFNYVSLHKEVEPMFLLHYPKYTGYALLKIQSSNTAKTLASIEKVWKKFCPNYAFEFHFMDEIVGQMYRSDSILAKVLGYFSLLAIFISCLGLFALAQFSSQQRTKEIGIRKVVGATVPSIISLLIKEFAKWVLVANIFAWPIAWFVINKWLQNFAYHINLTIWSFLLAGVLVFMVSIFTVGYQTIRAATAKPIDSMRYE